MSSVNEITGDSICSKFSKTFADGWDRIFGKKITISKPWLCINSSKCLLCGSVVRSNYRWDYNTCSCGNLSVDGGHDYSRLVVGDSDKVEDMNLYSDDISVIREYFTWKSYGKNGEFPEGVVRKLSELTDSHIAAIIATQWHIKGTSTEEILNAEIQYRKVKGIVIDDSDMKGIQIEE